MNTNDNKPPSMMKAVEISEPGGAEVLRLTERPTPSPAPGEVLIKTAAAGVNRPERAAAHGALSPATRRKRFAGS